MSEERLTRFTEWDAERDRLAEEFPGWRIWYVPRTRLGGGLEILWCAQPGPLLNCGSTRELAREMRAADRCCQAEAGRRGGYRAGRAAEDGTGGAGGRSGRKCV